jgi:hypothetical protein
MPTRNAIATLDSMFDLFRQMGSGIALDLHWLAISRRLQQIRADAVWSADMDFVAVKLKAYAAHFAATYEPDLGSETIKAANAAKLDRVVEQYAILRAHIEQEPGEIARPA